MSSRRRNLLLAAIVIYVVGTIVAHDTAGNDVTFPQYTAEAAEAFLRGEEEPSASDESL